MDGIEVTLVLWGQPAKHNRIEKNWLKTLSLKR